jgi:hypothetical protein
MLNFKRGYRVEWTMVQVPQRVILISEIFIGGITQKIHTPNILIKVTASGTFSTWLPSKLVDGGSVEGSTYPTTNCAHTADAAETWWSLDLGMSRKISKLSIANRADAQMFSSEASYVADTYERNLGLKIYLGDVAGTPDGVNDRLCRGSFDLKMYSIIKRDDRHGITRMNRFRILMHISMYSII